ncbi:MAG: hypothetical protein AVDCRST_MAG50-1461, partial [uncultured Acidimicrobiales bacterium]
ARGARGHATGAQGRHSAVRRPGGLNGPHRDARPGGRHGGRRRGGRPDGARRRR